MIACGWLKTLFVVICTVELLVIRDKIRKALYKCAKFPIRFGGISVYMINYLDLAGQYMRVHLFLFLPDV